MINPPPQYSGEGLAEGDFDAQGLHSLGPIR
jgi:hypothetical protein